MLYKLIEKINRKTQIRIIIIIIVIGTICYIYAEVPRDYLSFQKFNLFSLIALYYLSILCILLLLLFPVFSIMRERILTNRIFNEKLKQQQLKLETVCNAFNLDYETMHNKYHKTVLTKKEVLKLIMEYFIN